MGEKSIQKKKYILETARKVFVDFSYQPMEKYHIRHRSVKALSTVEKWEEAKKAMQTYYDDRIPWKMLEENYYLIGERYIRLFDRAQFDQFFGQFTTLSLEEIHTVRFKNQRDHWEFIFQKHNEVST